MLLLTKGAGSVAPERRFALAVFAAAAVCGLVQYPFSAPVYWCYVAPLGALAAAAAFSLRPAPPLAAARLALACLVVFAALWVNRGSIYGLGVRWMPNEQTEPLRAAIGGGVRIRPREAVAYGIVEREMRAHAGGSPWACAGPDTPELYPVSRLRNPTRDLFEQFDEPAAFEPTLLRTLEARGVNVVVINEKPYFSRPLSPPTGAVLDARYPHARRVGDMTVRWRDAGGERAMDGGVR